MGARARYVTSRRDEAGAAVVEFALVASLLILLLFGIVDFGWLVNRDTMINNASREGAREASINPATSDVRDTVLSYLSTLPTLDPDDITVTCRKPSNAPCALESVGPDAPVSGDVAVVRVQYTHQWLTPVTPTFFGAHVVLDKTTEMRIE